MKKLILTCTVALACVGAFAQGKVRFVNDSLHLVYFTTDTTHLLAADQALAGQGTLSNGQGANGQTLAADLWVGTSSSGLTKTATTSFTTGGLAGTFTGANVAMASPFNNPLTYFFQVQVYDAASGSYASASTNSGHYYGESTVFQSSASSGAAYFSIVQLTTPASSTWAIGSFDLGAGNRGAISLQANLIPEPATAALAGLALASVAILRRRKQ
jgi:hypothetical protein